MSDDKQEAVDDLNATSRAFDLALLKARQVRDAVTPDLCAALEQGGGSDSATIDALRHMTAKLVVHGAELSADFASIAPASRCKNA